MPDNFVVLNDRIRYSEAKVKKKKEICPYIMFQLKLIPVSVPIASHIVSGHLVKCKHLEKHVNISGDGLWAVKTCGAECLRTGTEVNTW